MKLVVNSAYGYLGAGGSRLRQDLSRGAGAELQHAPRTGVGLAVRERVEAFIQGDQDSQNRHANENFRTVENEAEPTSVTPR